MLTCAENEPSLPLADDFARQRVLKVSVPEAGVDLRQHSPQGQPELITCSHCSHQI
jgi:hypothetical protein